MAIDTALRRASAVHVGMPWRGMLPIPDGTIATEDRYAVGGMYSGLIATPPTLLSAIGNISAPFDSGTYTYDLSVYFSGATSYSIDPSVETGWDFDVDTGILTIDTDDEDTFGPFVVTADNGSTADSNPFTVKVSAASIPIYSDGFGFGSPFRIGF